MEIKLSDEEKDRYNELKLKLDAAIRTKDKADIDHATRMLSSYQNEVLTKARVKINWPFTSSSEH